ncbi:hypothetical protein K523DRAFT_307537 [Schizophyllum commune Tattone D]|nr:hypothetical protein K523DRAFT_307537 [Schizophyllum commune Tattone D]
MIDGLSRAMDERKTIRTTTTSGVPLPFTLASSQPSRRPYRPLHAGTRPHDPRPHDELNAVFTRLQPKAVLKRSQLNAARLPVPSRSNLFALQQRFHALHVQHAVHRSTGVYLVIYSGVQYLLMHNTGRCYIGPAAGRGEEAEEERAMGDGGRDRFLWENEHGQSKLRESSSGMRAAAFAIEWLGR